VEPDVEFYCVLEYDPFVFMEGHGIKYGFSIMLSEVMATIPSLMSAVIAYQAKSETASTTVMDLFKGKNCGGGFIRTGICEKEGWSFGINV
jgi:hypothetical protein